MLKTHVSRVAAGAVISAALTAGSLGLAATAAGACADPNCVKGVPPVKASAMECTDTGCHSGTQPAAAPRPGSRVTGRRVTARADASTAINCPPPHPEVTALSHDISDC